MNYRPRQAPARFFEGAPEIVRKGVLDIISIIPAAPLEYDIIFSGPVTDRETGEVYGYNGLDFGEWGAQGCHFFLSVRPGADLNIRDYRERNRRRRVAWRDLPEPTQRAILRYLES